MDYTKREWSSLTQLRDTIVRDNSEKIVSFNGFELETTNHVYSLYNRELSQWVKEKPKRKRKTK